MTTNVLKLLDSAMSALHLARTQVAAAVAANTPAFPSAAPTVPAASVVSAPPSPTTNTPAIDTDNTVTTPAAAPLTGGNPNTMEPVPRAYGEGAVLKLIGTDYTTTVRRVGDGIVLCEMIDDTEKKMLWVPWKQFTIVRPA